MQIVWFKRDLRIEDHHALGQAAQRGPVLPLYIVEPELWSQPDMAARHWAFIQESLVELRAALAAAGQPLVVRTGDVLDVLSDVQATFGPITLWSHEETGNNWTFTRDKRVAQWCAREQVEWHEVQNHGVKRRLASRDGWAGQWDRFMAQPTAGAPALAPVDVDLGGVPSSRDLGLAWDPCEYRQKGGRAAGLERLDSFLHERGAPYRKAMSSPLAGEDACSRLSAHLAWGTVSMREVAQRTWARQRALKAAPPRSMGPWRGSMTSFSARLHW
ncbi:MAG: deoxyribodipyrimidine photo-lyase, partial [Pseudomonadota bacterium]